MKTPGSKVGKTGKNADPAHLSARGRKSRQFSPWGKGPTVNSERARRKFDEKGNTK